MDDKTFYELRQYVRVALRTDEQAGIIARLTFYKHDGSNVEPHELERFNDAMIELAVEHGLDCGGTMRLDRDGELASVDQEIDEGELRPEHFGLFLEMQEHARVQHDTVKNSRDKAYWQGIKDGMRKLYAIIMNEPQWRRVGASSLTQRPESASEEYP